GPRAYGGGMIDDAFMGGGGRAGKKTDIWAALALYPCADANLVGCGVFSGAVLIAICWAGDRYRRERRYGPPVGSAFGQRAHHRKPLPGLLQSVRATQSVVGLLQTVRGCRFP